jgi:hypothetical protein
MSQNKNRKPASPVIQSAPRVVSMSEYADSLRLALRQPVPEQLNLQIDEAILERFEKYKEFVADLTGLQKVNQDKLMETMILNYIDNDPHFHTWVKNVEASSSKPSNKPGVKLNGAASSSDSEDLDVEEMLNNSLGTGGAANAVNAGNGKAEGGKTANTPATAGGKLTPAAT